MILVSIEEKERKLINDRVSNWIFSLLYAYVFIYLIPWVDFYGEELADVYAYMARIIYLHNGGHEAVYSGINWVLSEPIWKEVILFISDYTTDYRAALYFISAVTVFLYISFLLKRVEVYVAMIFLVNPMMVDLFLAQMRSALAFGIVLMAYDLSLREERSKLLPILLLLIAMMIHASMPLFYLFFFLLYYYNNRVEDYKYYFIALLFGLLIAFFMKYGVTAILKIIGDRHAGFDEYISGSSIAYSITWMIIAFIIGTFGDFTDRRKRILAGYAIMMMSYFFFSSVVGIFAARYVALTMPLIIVSVGYLPKHIREGTYLFLLLYNIYSFKYWLQFSIF